MTEYEINSDYLIEGKVLGKPFTMSVYTKSNDNFDDVVYSQRYMYFEGNYSCDCNKHLLGNNNDEGSCGDSVSYSELYLLYKGTKTDLLKVNDEYS